MLNIFRSIIQKSKNIEFHKKSLKKHKNRKCNKNVYKLNVSLSQRLLKLQNRDNSRWKVNKNQSKSNVRKCHSSSPIRLCSRKKNVDKRMWINNNVQKQNIWEKQQKNCLQIKIMNIKNSQERNKKVYKENKKIDLIILPPDGHMNPCRKKPILKIKQKYQSKQFQNNFFINPNQQKNEDETSSNNTIFEPNSKLKHQASIKISKYLQGSKHNHSNKLLFKNRPFQSYKTVVSKISERKSPQNISNIEWRVTKNNSGKIIRNSNKELVSQFNIKTVVDQNSELFNSQASGISQFRLGKKQ